MIKLIKKHIQYYKTGRAMLQVQDIYTKAAYKAAPGRIVIDSIGDSWNMNLKDINWTTEQKEKDLDRWVKISNEPAITPPMNAVEFGKWLDNIESDDYPDDGA